jgi:hypothetical protein
VTLLVGTEKKPHTLHKDLLCFYSEYFRAAFQGSFKEATELKIELAQTTETVFEHFQVWLYTRRLDSVDRQTSTLVGLWVFGDQHQIPLLQNRVVDELFERRFKHNDFKVAVLPCVYANTLPGSVLRKAVIEICSSLRLEEDPQSSLNKSENWSVESLIDLVRAVHCRPKDAGKYSLPKRETCFFHVHGKDEHC